MNRRRKIRRAVRRIALLFLGIIIYEFLWGKLFPFSPLFPGFSRHEYAYTIFYVQHGASYSNLQKIDALVPAVEDFHEWKFKRKPRIFIFRDHTSFADRTFSKARFFTVINSRIFVTHRAMSDALSDNFILDLFLRHELSHSLIDQHAGIIGASRYPAWLMEGIATYSAGQLGTSIFPSRQETYQLISRGNFMPPDYYQTDNERSVQVRVIYYSGFLYSEFACIVEYLIETYGKRSFISYMRRLAENPDNEEAFKSSFDTDFATFIEEFKAQVIRSNRNPGYAGNQ